MSVEKGQAKLDELGEVYAVGAGEQPPVSATETDQAPEWPPLIPLDAPALPSLDPALLPGWAGQYAEALTHATETPPELPAAMVLTAAATAAARRVQVEVRPGYVESCNLWMAAALPPGTRKSAVQSAATRPIQAWEREKAEAVAPDEARVKSEREAQMQRAQKLRQDAAKAEDDDERTRLAREAGDLDANLPEMPERPQLWTSDATPERLGVSLADNGERMAWLSSEGGVFDLLSGRYSSGIPNLDLVLKAWSGDPERVDRGNRPDLYLSRPLLTVGLSPQPEVLRGLAARPGFRGRGLLGRFLYLLPPSPLGYRHLEPDPVPEGVEAAYHAGIRAMLEWPPADDEGTPYTVRLSSQAYAEWLAFAQWIETQMRPGGDCESAPDWAGKAPGQAARLAGVLHGIHHAHGAPWESEVSATTMTAALELMAVITRHSLYAMDVMGADESVAAARKVWDWIEGGRRDGFTITEAHKALKGTFPRVAGVKAALEVLQERGYVEVIHPKQEGPGRPSSPRVIVRPNIVEGWR